MSATVDVARYGPWALVTGASDGIGKAMAEQLTSAGMSLILVARRGEVLTELADTWQLLQRISIITVAADLAHQDAIAQIATATADLDVGLVVLAAGYGSIGEFTAATTESDADMIAVNIGAVTALAHLFGPRLARRRRGGMVLFGSILGWQGGPLQATYAATMAYNQSLAEALRVEWQRAGVDVLSVAPGPVHTGFADRARMRMRAAATPEVVARAAMAGLGRRGTVVPGIRGKVQTYGLRSAPRRLRVRIMHRISRSFQQPTGIEGG